MHSIKIIWEHDNLNYPAEIFSQIDEDNYEVRKIEIYKNGNIAYADKNKEAGTFLNPEPMPSLEELNTPNGIDIIKAFDISNEQFNNKWAEIKS